VNYPPANVQTAIALDPAPESEPELLTLTWNLRLPASWPVERRAEFLCGWHPALTFSEAMLLAKGAS
jgi:hypothetical protein